MRILQLCCFTNLWSQDHQVENWDLRLKKNIFDIPNGYANGFDLVVAAPPCDQFTKANAHHWQAHPGDFVAIAQRCFEICKQTGSIWFLENPPGRIEKFIPGLKQYRGLTWRASSSNKEYVLYSNFLILQSPVSRYPHGKEGTRKFGNQTKKQREAWDPDLIRTVETCL